MTFPNFPDESLSEINLNCVTCPCLTPCCCLYSGQQHRETSLPKLPHFKGKLWKNKLFTEGYQGRERFLLFVVFIGENRPTLPSRLYHWLESDEDSRGAAARKAASRNEVNRRRTCERVQEIDGRQSGGRKKRAKVSDGTQGFPKF